MKSRAVRYKGRFMSAAIAVCILAVFLSSGADAAEPAPGIARHENTNVILISLQCLKPDHLGAYGYKRDTSRNIDALARKSVLFEQAIAHANLTPVAQMSVFTSQYPRIHGMVSFEVTKDMVKEKTLPEILKYYGYTTAAVVSSPEFFMRFDTTSGHLVNPGDVFSRSFDYFGRSIRGLDGRSLRKLPLDSLKWIRDNRDKKFFLWIASGLLHMPYGASVPLPVRKMYDPPDYIPFWKRIPQVTGKFNRSDDPSYQVFSRVYRGDFYWDFSPVYHLTETDIQYVNARYDAGVFYTDQFIGQLMELLDSLDLTEKTLIVLQSIHGDDLGEQGNFFHYDVTDSVIKNALLIRFPDGEYSGKRVPQQVQGIDIMPTVLSYLDISVPHEAEGSSLLPLLNGDALSPGSEYIYIDRMPWWEFNLSRWYLDFERKEGAYFPPSEKERFDAYRLLLKNSFGRLDYPPGDIAIRSNAWKLILRKNHELHDAVSWWGFITGTKQESEETELYDLKNDPFEIKNVARDNPEVVLLLKSKLLAWDDSMEKQKPAYGKDKKLFIIPYP